MSEVPLRPQERRRAFQLLRGYLPSLGSRLGSYTTFLDGVLRDLERRQAEHVVFDLLPNGRCAVNGREVPFSGKGLTLAWLVLVTEQYAIDEAIGTTWLYPKEKRPAACARQALSRAADAVERCSLVLASAIRAIGTKRGILVLLHPVEGIRCTSPTLARLCNFDST